jgi:molybdopterin-guanine dinucleotide biosynthesis protein A
MSAFILAGGRSTRMRRDKASLLMGGRTFLDRAIECTSAVFDRVYIVGRIHDDPRVDGSFPDRIQGVGPIGGIYSALHVSVSEYNFFIGIDYPLAFPEAVRVLAGFIDRRYLGLIPVMPDGPHPLFAFYSRHCLSPIERCLQKKRYEIRCIAREAPVLFVDVPKALDRSTYDRVKSSFTNINDLREYREMLQAEQTDGE